MLEAGVGVIALQNRSAAVPETQGQALRTYVLILDIIMLSCLYSAKTRPPTTGVPAGAAEATASFPSALIGLGDRSLMMACVMSRDWAPMLPATAAVSVSLITIKGQGMAGSSSRDAHVTPMSGFWVVATPLLGLAATLTLLVYPDEVAAGVLRLWTAVNDAARPTLDEISRESGPTIALVVQRLLSPGLYAFEKLGQRPVSTADWLVATGLSWIAWRYVTRVAGRPVGRLFASWCAGMERWASNIEPAFASLRWYIGANDAFVVSAVQAGACVASTIAAVSFASASNTDGSGRLVETFLSATAALLTGGFLLRKTLKQAGATAASLRLGRSYAGLRHPYQLTAIPVLAGFLVLVMILLAIAGMVGEFVGDISDKPRMASLILTGMSGLAALAIGMPLVFYSFVAVAMLMPPVLYGLSVAAIWGVLAIRDRRRRPAGAAGNPTTAGM